MINELTSVEWFKLAHETAKELIAPWKWALLITNVLWCTVLICLLWFAYFNPEELGQKVTQETPGYSQRSEQYKGNGKQ